MKKKITTNKILLLGLTLSIFLLLINFAQAQSITLDLGNAGGNSTAGAIIRLFIITTLLTLAPSFVLMLTSFTRLLVVFSILRNSLGTGNTPPNQILVSLALFLTIFIMQPVIEQSWYQGIEPMLNNKMGELEALKKASEPFKKFILSHTREEDLQLFLNIAKSDPKNEAEIPIIAAIPAFIISELLHAFEIGFLLYLPFIIIDMIIASILMGMGMFMLPPMVLSLPFKLIFFVLVDGWHMVVGSLVKSYGS